MESVKQTLGLSQPRLAWIGLGNIGRGMVRNIIEKGQFKEPLVLYNRTAARAEQLAATLQPSKCRVAASIAETVDQADIIFTCVGNDAAVQAVIDAALATPDVKGKLFVDCSTIHPNATNALAKQINAAGAEFVACPVFGAPAMADNGQLVCVLAGPKAQVDRVRPFCKGVVGRAEIDYSDQPQGAATRLKIIGNTFVLSMVETLAEGHVLAEKSGLGVDNLHSFIETMFPGPYAAYSKRFLSGDYWNRNEPLFDAKLARKDAGHAKDLAQQAGVKLPILDIVDQHLQDVIDHSGDKGDIAGVYGAVRKEASLKFENQ